MKDVLGLMGEKQGLTQEKMAQRVLATRQTVSCCESR